MKKIFLGLFLTLGALAPNAAVLDPPSGRIFHVSFSGGNDANDGITVGTPWKTFTKVTAGPAGGYLQDDQILFKQGDTWTGATITTQASGTSGHQIHYGAYGTGALPILDANGATNVFKVVHDFITIENVQMRNTTSALVNFSGQTGTQILHTVDKNAGTHVFFGSHTGTVLTGTTTIVGNTYTVDAGKPSSGNEIEIWTDNHGTNLPLITVTDNFLDRSTASGALNGSCIVVAGAINAILDRNTCIAGTQGIGVKPYQRTSDGANCQVGDLSTGGGSISDNKIIDMSTAQGDGEGVELQGCSSANPQSGMTIARNLIHCLASTVVGAGSSDAIGGYFATDMDIFGNVIIGACHLGTNSTIPRMVTFSSSCTNIRFYNNTIIGPGPGVSPRGPLAAVAWLSGSGAQASGGIAKNNIIKGVDRGIARYNAVGTSLIEDYNVMDTDVTTPFSVLGGSTIDHGTHTLVGTHPGFVVNAPVTFSDVKLAHGSPAIGTGLAIGAPFNLILNPVPTVYPYGTYDQAAGVWMRGAFGPTAVSIGPTISGAVVSGATTR